MRKYKIPFLFSCLTLLVNFNLFIQPIAGFFVSVILLFGINIFTWKALASLFSIKLKNTPALEWAVGVFIFILGMYGYGSIFYPEWLNGAKARGMADIASAGQALEQYKILYYTLLILVSIGVYFISKNEKVRAFLNTFILFAIAVVFINKAISYYKTYSGFVPKEIVNVDELNKDSIVVKPDIYYFLLDGYAGNTALKTYWQFDNSRFKDSLINLGFQVADSARGNYAATIAVVSSVFNLSTFKHPELFEHNMDLTVFNQIRKNVLFEMLDKQGYAIAPNSLLFDKTPFFFSQGDVNPNSAFFSNLLTRHLIYRVGLKITDKITNNHFGWLSWYYDYDKRVANEIDRQKNVTVSAKPTFYYNHLMLTHVIFRYDTAGVPIITEDTDTISGKYLDQVQYTNSVCIKYFSELVERYKKQNKPLVIIAQSDHGSKELKKREEESQIQLMIYDSEHKFGQLRADEDGVNLMRQVVNSYFGYHLPRQEYEYYDIYAHEFSK